MERLTADDLAPGLRTERFGRRVIYLQSTGSTNLVARDLARSGAPEGTLVIAEKQTQGRGRMGRTWLAPAGSSLLLSILFRPSLPPTLAFRLTMLSSVAMAMAVERACEIRPSIKWPNDLLLGDKKLAGILSESSLAGQELDYAIVGIGINVNFDTSSFPEIAATATSLQAALGRAVSRLGLLQAFLNELEAGCQYLAPATDGADRLWSEWRDRLSTLGKQVTVTEGEHRESGLAEEVAADGSLVLRRDDGSTVSIAVGDVTLRA